MDLSLFKIQHDLVPETIYYVPDFITEAEESRLIGCVLQAPKPKWTYLSNRSLQNWGGLPHPKGMIQEPMPNWLQQYADKLCEWNVFDGKTPNHVLMNRYEPGQGIMAHEDGPLFYPTVATINTGSHTILKFYKKPMTDAIDGDYNRHYVFSLLLWPRSLLVLKQDAYTTYLHEIEELTVDNLERKQIPNIDQIKSLSNDVVQLERQTRYSFTIRLVTNVLRSNLKDLLFSPKVK